MGNKNDRPTAVLFFENLFRFQQVELIDLDTELKKQELEAIDVSGIYFIENSTHNTVFTSISPKFCQRLAAANAEIKPHLNELNVPVERVRRVDSIEPAAASA